MKLFRIIAITVAVSLAALGAAVVSTPAPALATTLEISGGTPEQAAKLQQIVNESQEPTPAGTISVTLQECGYPGLEHSCTIFPNAENGWTVPHVRISPEDDPTVILHELGHVSAWVLDHEISVSDPIREEFQRIVGKAGSRWFGEVPDPYVKEAPDEEWADTLMSCSRMGRIATGPYAITPSYEFKLTAEQYNQACAFFAQILVGPQFTQPTAAPLSSIPYNYTESALCGARPEQVQYCGSSPVSQGFGEFRFLPFERANSKSHASRRVHRSNQRSGSVPTPVRATKIVMSNPKQQAAFQAIVDHSQEPTPNLAIRVHLGECPDSAAKVVSCVVYPSHANGWTAPQIWVSPTDKKFFILGELAYVSWWELDSSTLGTATAARELSEAFQQNYKSAEAADLTWRLKVEDTTVESPAHVWADAMLSCSWMGRTIHHDQSLETVGYKFQFNYLQYNQMCAFFAKTLVGPKFSSPITSALPVIPRNYARSNLCGARSELVKYCGKLTKKGKRIKKHR